MALFGSLGSFVGGLLPGVGAAAQGYGAGKIKAEQTQHDRQRQAEERALRALAIQSRKHELDPEVEIRKNAGRQANALEAQLASKDLQEFLQTPQGKGYGMWLGEKIQKFRDIEYRRIPISEVSTQDLSSPWDFSAYQRLVGNEGGGAPQGGVPAPAPAPEQPAPQGIVSTPAIMDMASELGGRLGLRAPGTSMASLGAPGPVGPEYAPPRGLGTPVPPGPNIGPPIPTARLGPPPSFAAPVRPPAAPVRAPVVTPTPKAPPVSQEMANYIKIRNNPPVSTPNPGETPDKFEARKEREYSRWEKQRDDARKDLSLEDELAIKAAERKSKETQAHYAASEAEGKRKGGISTRTLQKAQTEAATESALTSRATRGGKVRGGLASAALTEKKVGSYEAEQQREQERLNLSRRMTAVAEGSLGETKKRNIRLAQEFDRTMAIKSTDTRVKAAQQELENAAKIYTAQQGGMNRLLYPQADREQAYNVMVNRIATITKLNAEAGKKIAGGGAAGGPEKPSRAELLKSAARMNIPKADIPEFLRQNGYPR